MKIVTAADRGAGNMQWQTTKEVKRKDRLISHLVLTCAEIALRKHSSTSWKRASFWLTV